MTTKLHINLSQGIIDVEGDPSLVREIYENFKDQLLQPGVNQPAYAYRNDPEPAQAEAGVVPDPAPPRNKRSRSTQKARQAPDSDASTVSARSPKLDRDLDTARLPEFYQQFEPTNHPEKILIFLKFLTEELGIPQPNTDQVYTCYVRVNERIPKAYAQAFRDTSGRKFGYIEFNSAIDLRITTAGNNHFNFDLKRKSA